MTPDTKVEPDRASLAAAEGLAALGVGDTALAQQKYAEAGEILLKELGGVYKQADKMLLRFLAATQFYKGGHYQRALEVCKKIETRLLPESVRGLFPPFLNDVKLRAAPGYAAGVDRTLTKAYTERDYRRVLDLLRDHPYVLTPGKLAYVRAVACEEIGEWQAATLFHESAIRYSSGDPDFVSSAALMPLKLLSQNRLREARESIDRQLELSQHPVTTITAAVIAFRQAESVSQSEWTEGVAEQSHYLDQAWDEYQQLPEAQRNDPWLRRYMAFGLASGAKAAIMSRDKSRAKEILERVGQLGDVAGSTHRTAEHLRNFLEKNSLAVDNLFDVETFVKSEREQISQQPLLSLAP
jgi:tetratricopeptide (TPR) repeat protein